MKERVLRYSSLRLFVWTDGLWDGTSIAAWQAPGARSRVLMITLSLRESCLVSSLCPVPYLSVGNGFSGTSS